MSWEWILGQAQQYGVAYVLMLGAVVVLWRTHVQDQKTIREMSRSQGEAMTATAVAMEKVSAAIREGRVKR